MKLKEDPISHLKKDKKLKVLIERLGILKQTKHKDVYMSMSHSIVSQQLSIKAANTIWGRYINLFENAYPKAEQVLSININTLRSVGLSFQKAGYLKNIAEFYLNDGFNPKLLNKKTDEELIAHFVQIKGVGRWTAEMVLMFSMRCTDIFPVDDLGIRQGIKRVYNLKSENKQLIKEICQIAEKWRPYRSVACLYIWRHKDTTIEK